MPRATLSPVHRSNVPLHRALYPDELAQPGRNGLKPLPPCPFVTKSRPSSPDVALTAATSFRIGEESIFFPRSISASHGLPGLRRHAAVRVPPSPEARRNRSHRPAQVFRSTWHVATADEPLDFRAPPIEPAFGDVARLPGIRRIWQHRILGRKPAAGDALLFHPAWHRLLDHHPANDSSISHRHQDRPAVIRRDPELE